MLPTLGSAVQSMAALPLDLPLGGGQRLSLPSASLEGVDGVLHSLLHEQLHELFLADVPVGVAIDLREDAPDAIVGLLALQELGHFLVADVPAVVDVEVFEGSLVVLPLEVTLRVQRGNDELGVLYLAGAVEVDQPHHHLQPLLVADPFLHDGLELLQTDRPVPIGVRPLEDLLQVHLLAVGQQL